MLAHICIYIGESSFLKVYFLLDIVFSHVFLSGLLTIYQPHGYQNSSCLMRHSCEIVYSTGACNTCLWALSLLCRVIFLEYLCKLAVPLLVKRTLLWLVMIHILHISISHWATSYLVFAGSVQPFLCVRLVQFLTSKNFLSCVGSPPCLGLPGDRAVSVGWA